MEPAILLPFATINYGIGRLWKVAVGKARIRPGVAAPLVVPHGFCAPSASRAVLFKSLVGPSVNVSCVDEGGQRGQQDLRLVCPMSKASPGANANW